MDAVTVAAAALAVVVEESRDAAMRDLLLERERLAMTVADRESFLSQRLFTESTQVLSAMRPMTWRAAHLHVQNDMLEARDAMHAARRALRRGNVDRAEALLSAELASNSNEELSDEDDVEHVCALCRRLSRIVYEMPSSGRWEGLDPEERLLCGACHRLQPEQ